MRPITFTEKEAQVIYLALQITESAWELHALMGRVNPQPEENQAALDGIRGKLAEAAVPAWNGAHPPGDEDDLGFVPDSKRGD